MIKKIPSATKVVVIGGGVAGCSTAYHLAKFGWKETILLESLFFLIALAIEDPIKPQPTIHTFLNIILNPNQFFLLC